MKFLASIVLASLLMIGTATAQKVNFGIKGGLNVYNIHNSNGTNYDPVAGFHAGVLAHIHLSKRFALQPETFFSTNGANFKNGPFETKYNLGYIQVPVLLQYMILDGLRLQAGPQVGFLVSAKSKTGDLKEDFKNDVNSVDFGLATGASYLIPKTGFGFDARYNLGLSDINKNGSVKSTNRGFQLGVFYLFNKH